MITQQEVKRVASLQNEEGILSVYVKIDPRLMYDPGQPAAKFKGALKRFERAASERQRAVAEREKPAVPAFLENSTPHGRGLAIFSCQPAGIWEVAPLDVLVPSYVTVDDATDTATLAQVVDEYPRFVAALVQRDHAAIFVAEQRASEPLTRIDSDVPGQHDQGGWAQARWQRHIEFHFEEHLKKVIDALQHLYYERPYARLAIGAVQDVGAELWKMLPDPISRRVIGVFPVDFKHETQEEMLERAYALVQEDERRCERELVDRAVDAAAAGGLGAVGIEETMRAVLAGRIQTLIVAEGVTKEGSACLECDYFGADISAVCPRCAAEGEVTDVVERMVEKAYLTGASVETVFGEARDWLLSRGGVAAILRY